MARKKTENPEPTSNSEDTRSNPKQTVIDWGILHRLRDYNQKDRVGLFEELIFGFLEQAASKVTELGRLMVEKNHPRMVQTAHALKGMSINFGAVVMVRECEIFQRMAELALDPELVTALERLKEALSMVHQTLIQFTKTSGGEVAGGPPQPQKGVRTTGD